MEILICTDPEDRVIGEDIIARIKKTIELMTELYAIAETEVSVTLTDDEHIRILNKEYRNIDRATDVLSFAFLESEEPAILNNSSMDKDEAMNKTLGDIIISLDKVREQALEYGHSEERELSFLVVHGMLHLLGYDHIEEADRIEMENEQCIIMEKLGILR